jgi:hypothetical protein
MLASSHWRELPASLQAVISDVDGCGTDLGVFLEAADLAVQGCRASSGKSKTKGTFQSVSSFCLQ